MNCFFYWEKLSFGLYKLLFSYVFIVFCKCRVSGKTLRIIWASKVERRAELSAHALGTGHSNGALVGLAEALRAWLVRPGKPYVACVDGPPVLNGQLGSPRMHLRAGSKGNPLRTPLPGWPYKVAEITSPCWWGAPSKAFWQVPRENSAHGHNAAVHRVLMRLFFVGKDGIRDRALDSYTTSYDLEKLYKCLFLYHYFELKETRLWVADKL